MTTRETVEEYKCASFAIETTSKIQVLLAAKVWWPELSQLSLCLAFDKENSIEFPLDSVHYLYMKSNPNPSFYPVLLYESLFSCTSIDKKIKEKKKKRKIIIRN